jgi:hypothetical protein
MSKVKKWLGIIFLIAVAIYVLFSGIKQYNKDIEGVENSKQELTLEAAGLGIVSFGSTPEEVISKLTPILGAPSRDTGWISGFSAYGTCPSEQIRVLHWNSLIVLFGDTVFGAQKFFLYNYVNYSTGAAIPFLETSQGLTLGMSKSEVLSLYPQVQIIPWERAENHEDMRLMPTNEDTGQFFGGTLEGGKVSWIAGGIGCGD